MTPKVEPTVKWEDELNKIPLIEIKMMNDVWNSLKPVPSHKLVSFIRTLLAQSVQEAKEEERERIQTEIALITARNANKQGTFANIHIWANDIANFISTLNTKEGKT